MKFDKNSWIAKLIREYKKVSIENWDKANGIITKALFELEELNFERVEK